MQTLNEWREEQEIDEGFKDFLKQATVGGAAAMAGMGMMPGMGGEAQAEEPPTRPVAAQQETKPMSKQQIAWQKLMDKANYVTGQGPHSYRYKGASPATHGAMQGGKAKAPWQRRVQTQQDAESMGLDVNPPQRSLGR